MHINLGPWEAGARCLGKARLTQHISSQTAGNFIVCDDYFALDSSPPEVSGDCTREDCTKEDKRGAEPFHPSWKNSSKHFGRLTGWVEAWDIGKEEMESVHIVSGSGQWPQGPWAVFNPPPDANSLTGRPLTGSPPALRSQVRCTQHRCPQATWVQRYKSNWKDSWLMKTTKTKVGNHTKERDTSL